MALNIVKRFQFCLNTDDAEIVRLGLDGFAEQISQNEVFSLTLAALCIDPISTSVDKILHKDDNVEIADYPIVELYLNSSPRLEEMFSVWSLLTGRRELETALSAHFLRCFVFILQILPENDSRYADITLRILREHETGLIRQLQSTDSSTVAYTMLLVSLCLRAHKSLSEPLLNALLTSYKSLKSLASKPGRLPIFAGFSAVVLLSHFFTYLEYTQCLLVLSEEKLVLDLLYHGSLPTLHLLLDMQQQLWTSGSNLFRDHLSYFLNNQTINKLLNMRSKISTAEFDSYINPFLRDMSESLLIEVASITTVSAQSKTIFGAIYAILDNLVPQFDIIHQEIILHALEKKSSLAPRCISSLKVSEWNPASPTLELTQALTYLTKATKYLRYDDNLEWSKHVRSPTAIFAILLPSGLSKKEIVKLISVSTVEVQLLAFEYVHICLQVIASHREHGQLTAIALEILEEELVDFKTLYLARGRLVEAFQQLIQRTDSVERQGTSNSSHSQTVNMKQQDEDLEVDMDLNLDGVVVTPTSKKTNKGNNAKTINNEEVREQMKQEKERISSLINTSISMWIQTMFVFVERYPSVLTQTKVDWNKVVDELTLLSTSKSIFTSETISHCLKFFSMIIRPSTFYMWFGNEEDIHKVLLNMIVTDWQGIKFSSFGHLLKFAFLGITATTSTATSTTDIASTETLQVFLYNIFRSLGIFEGHRNMDLSLTFELNSWILHLCNTASSAAFTAVTSNQPSSSSSASTSASTSSKQQLNALERQILLFDCLLRVSFRWRIDAAIACHELSTSSTISNETFGSTMSPISPLAYTALCLVLGDFELFLSIFPTYVRKYWDLLSTSSSSSEVLKDNSGEAKTKDDAEQFFARYTQGYRQLLEEWLLPWFAQVIIRHPQREQYVRWWKTIYDAKMNNTSCILITNMHDNVIFKLLNSDPTKTTGGLKSMLVPSPKATSSRMKRKSFHGLPIPEVKEILLPQLPNTVTMLHILSKELPSLLAFIRKQPRDAVALCLQSFVDDYGHYVRTQYFLENTVYRKMALDWVSESWQREKLLFISLQKNSNSKAKVTMLMLVHITPLLVTLQGLQTFINNTAMHYEESKENIVTSALRLADELFVLVMDILQAVSPNINTENVDEERIAVSLFIELLNTSHVVDHIHEATAYGMISRRVSITILSHLLSKLSSSAEKPDLLSNIRMVNNASTLFQSVLPVSSISSTSSTTISTALLDQTYVDLLACLLSISCTPDLLHVYFLLRFQVQANQKKVESASSTATTTPRTTATAITMSSSPIFAGNGYASYTSSPDLLWKGLQQLPFDVLWSIREQLRETIVQLAKNHSNSSSAEKNSLTNTLYTLYSHEEHGWTFIAPELLLMLQLAPISSSSLNNLGEKAAYDQKISSIVSSLSLTSIYERQYVLSHESSIRDTEHRIRRLIDFSTVNLATVSQNKPVLSVQSLNSMTHIIQFLVDMAIKVNQQYHKVVAIPPTTTTSALSDRNHMLQEYKSVSRVACSTLLTLLKSCRYLVASETTIIAQETISTQLNRWCKCILKYQFLDAVHLEYVREVVTAFYHPGLIGRCPRLKPKYMASDTGTAAEGKPQNEKATDFHHPANLLMIIPKHSSFISVMSVATNIAEVSEHYVDSDLSAMKIGHLRIVLMKLCLTILQLAIQPITEWNSYASATKEAIKQDIFEFESILIQYYSGTMSQFDRIILRMFQTLQGHAAGERLGRSWLQILPLLAIRKQQKQQKHRSKGRINHATSGANVASSTSNTTNNATSASVLSWLQPSIVQRTISEFPEHRSVMTQVFLWELFDANSTNNNGMSSSSISNTNDEERWQLVKHYQQPILPAVLTNSTPSSLTPAHERYLQRTYEKQLKSYQKWLSEHEIEQQKQKKLYQSQPQVHFLDIDTTDSSTFLHQSLNDQIYTDISSVSTEEMSNLLLFQYQQEEALSEIYDPAFVVPAFVQCVVQPHQSQDSLSTSESLRDLFTSGLSGLMCRSLSSTCMILRVCGYSYLDYVWQLFHAHEKLYSAYSSKEANADAPTNEENDEEEDDDHDSADSSSDDDDSNEEKANKNSSKPHKKHHYKGSELPNHLVIFRERLLVDVFLKYIKDSIVIFSTATTTPTNSTASATSVSELISPAPIQISTASALFFARGSMILLYPKHEHYLSLTKVLATTPCHNHFELPWFKSLLLQSTSSTTGFSSSNNNNQSSNNANNNNNDMSSSQTINEQDELMERLSALRFLRDCLHSHASSYTSSTVTQYPHTHQLFIPRQVYAQLLQHFTLFANRDLRAAQCILDIFDRSCSHPEAAYYLFVSTSSIYSSGNASSSITTRGFDIVSFLFSQAIVVPIISNNNNPTGASTSTVGTILNVLGGTYALRWLALLRKLTTSISLISMFPHANKTHGEHTMDTNPQNTMTNLYREIQDFIEYVLIQAVQVCTNQLLASMEDIASHNKHEQFTQFFQACIVTWQEIMHSLERIINKIESTQPAVRFSMNIQTNIFACIQQLFTRFSSWSKLFLTTGISGTGSDSTSSTDIMWSLSMLCVQYAPSAISFAQTTARIPSSSNDYDLWRWIMQSSLQKWTNSSINGEGKHTNHVWLLQYPQPAANIPHQTHPPEVKTTIASKQQDKPLLYDIWQCYDVLEQLAAQTSKGKLQVIYRKPHYFKSATSKPQKEQQLSVDTHANSTNHSSSSASELSLVSRELLWQRFQQYDFSQFQFDYTSTARSSTTTTRYEVAKVVQCIHSMTVEIRKSTVDEDKNHQKNLQHRVQEILIYALCIYGLVSSRGEEGEVKTLDNHRKDLLVSIVDLLSILIRHYIALKQEQIDYQDLVGQKRTAGEMQSSSPSWTSFTWMESLEQRLLLPLQEHFAQQQQQSTASADASTMNMWQQAVLDVFALTISLFTRYNLATATSSNNTNHSGFCLTCLEHTIFEQTLEKACEILPATIVVDATNRKNHNDSNSSKRKLKSAAASSDIIDLTDENEATATERSTKRSKHQQYPADSNDKKRKYHHEENVGEEWEYLEKRTKRTKQLWKPFHMRKFGFY